MKHCESCNEQTVFIEDDCMSCTVETKKIEVNLLLEVGNISNSDIEELIKHKVTQAIDLANDYVAGSEVKLLNLDIKNVETN